MFNALTEFPNSTVWYQLQLNVVSSHQLILLPHFLLWVSHWILLFYHCFLPACAANHISCCAVTFDEPCKWLLQQDYRRTLCYPSLRYLVQSPHESRGHEASLCTLEGTWTVQSWPWPIRWSRLVQEARLQSISNYQENHWLDRTRCRKCQLR